MVFVWESGTACGDCREREKTLVVSWGEKKEKDGIGFKAKRDSEPDLMKMRIYTTNVISRAIYTPKIVFACI